MTPERWQKVKEIFHAALDCGPGQRSAFLSSACGGDEALRKEVESLIASHEKDGGFIDSPAYQAAAETLRSDLEVKAGQTIGHYEILGVLGKGGMGEVYLAQDTRLGRKVALKFLPSAFTKDQERLRRFEQEARAASALNHPYILTIHEIGEADDRRFIATEFIDGETLRQRIMSDGLLQTAEALNIAEQIASALAAAHAEGIVHRDIKPENIMLRRDGYVKVLDFGLAKLAEQKEAGPEDETRARLETNAGVLMGTVTYMSPEQARGLAVDARTDIWSLGIVIYEMVTGQSPFHAATTSDIIASILDREPPALSKYAEEGMQELEWIVTKALRKDRDERYQSAKEFLSDLRNLKQHLAFDGELKRVSTGSGGTSSQSFEKFALDVASQRLVRSNEATVVSAKSSASDLINEIKNRKSITALIFATLVVAVGIAFGLYRLAGWIPSTKRAAAFHTIKLIKLTNTGKVKDAVISLDGQYVAYVEEDGGRESIWLRQTATPSNVQIVPPAEIQYYGLTLSLDGNFVYYIVKERGNSIGILYRVPVLGGASARLIVDVDGPVSLSPDGKQLAFIRGSSSGERALMLAKEDGTEQRKLASRIGPEAFSFGGPAWSPDGKDIACGAGDADANGRYVNVVDVQVVDGSIKPLSSQKWGGIGRVYWLRDNSGLVFTATEYRKRSSSQLWYIPYPNGEARRITDDFTDYNGVSLTGDSTVMVTKQTQTLSSIWLAPSGDANHARQVSSNKYDGFNGFYNRFTWTPDGRIMYTSITNGSLGIWTMNADGTQIKQLTTDANSNNFPSVTSDARYVVFVSDRAGFNNVWRIDADGNDEKQLTNGSDDAWPQCSPDGQWVIYLADSSGKRTLWRVPINGGTPAQLAEFPSVCPMVSPDGKWISCYYRSEIKAPWKLAIIPFAGGEPVKTLDIPPNVVFQSLVRWTPDGLALAYITSRNGVSNIWSQPLAGGSAKQLTDFQTDQIFWFDWSRDGKQLALSRGNVSSDIVLIQNLR